MKKFIVSALSLVVINSFSYANEIDPDLKKPMSYSVEVQDSGRHSIYSANLNNLSKKVQEQYVDSSYIDNCIKNGSIIESTKNSIKTGFKVYFLEQSNIATSLVVDMSKVVGKNKINTGECSIEELTVAKASLTQGLPFLDFEYKLHLKDTSGKELPELYYIKIKGSNLNNIK